MRVRLDAYEPTQQLAFSTTGKRMDMRFSFHFRPVDDGAFTEITVDLDVQPKGLTKLAGPFLMKVAIDQYIAPGNPDGLGLIALLYVGSLLGVFVLRYGQTYLVISVGIVKTYEYTNSEGPRAANPGPNVVGTVVRRMSSGTVGADDSPGDSDLQFGDVGGGVVVVVLVVELAAVADEAVAAVVDPANQGFPGGRDAVHRPAIHGGCDLDDGEFDDADRIAFGHVVIPDVEPHVQHDRAVLGRALVLVLTDGDPVAGADGVEVGEHFGEEPFPGRPEVGVGQAVGDGLGDMGWLGLLDDDVLHVHVGVPFECSEVRFDSTQAFLFLADGLFDLGLAHPQHAPELLEGRVLFEHDADLFQGEAQVAQGHDAVELAELAGGVEAIPVGRIDLFRLEQADLVVVAQHARRHLPEPGELSDIQHDDAIDKASHRVKVKRFVSLVGGEVAFAGFEDGVCVLADKVALSAA